MNPPRTPPSVRPGFSLVEVTLAIGIVGVAILSLVGILGSTFQQVDEIMQTNRALSGVTRLIGALDNPRSIVYLDSTSEQTPQNTKYLLEAPGDDKGTGVDLTGSPSNPAASNFDIVYRLLQKARDNGDNAVWLYVYERKIVAPDSDKTGATAFALFSNPSMMEVALCSGKDLTVNAAFGRNIIGTPMRVRLSLSKLLVGQRTEIDTTGTPIPTFEPKTTKVPAAPWASSPLPLQPSDYALAYLPVVAEFFPHDYSPYSSPTGGFKTKTEAPLLVQNIVISR